MRLILKKNNTTHTKEMLDMLNWLSIKQTIFFFTMKLIFNIKHGRVPEYLTNKLQYVREVHQIQTRNCNDFRLKMFRTEADKRNINYEGLKRFNELPNDIKNCDNFLLFKSKLFIYCKTLEIR